MKKISYIFLATLFLSAIGTQTSAAEVKTYDSNGAITFVPSTDPIDPVDPLEPSNPITPIDPTNPDGPEPGTSGPLSIDYASSLSFGEQKISSKTETYYANAQKYKNAAANILEGPNFVQVSDNRGTESGWTLKVKQNGQFQTSVGQVLTGAKITFYNGNIVTASQSAKPSNFSKTLTLDPSGAEALVMSARVSEGAGTYLMDWGNSVDTAKKSIALEVPGSTTKFAKSYSTTFTWVLTDAPGN
ncbi:MULTISPECIES: WxL domain-containing protein [unclassified Enterococcus]|uniref:WxL domain-containing protein n=1 Tax=unclassified Enterococcus TaxID=2608891 RepID=UPI001555FAD0|nr:MULTISPECIES: WxL domain-containing protein [unclassified Enterococcus]MBS7577359.1 WxL domain-containing protein [Enterococcus sp. MMGLQ5-2]MBS7584766.1 WxL domain-containing protein [Enterococcus sp. MMGLQ5-1]NPD12621.1 WxL domain-containing protein [Enterococcus sp. MMGLQ5-1]NPD37193.1 WxL domain-containing protein [Enterococcus sp. MMGLQ5-2]